MLRVEAIYVLSWVACMHNSFLIKVFGQWQLHMSQSALRYTKYKLARKSGQHVQIGMDLEVHLNKNTIHRHILTYLADS